MTNTPSIRKLPFQSIPHQPGVFLQYIASAPAALSWYRHPPGRRALVEAARAALQNSFPRDALVEILTDQNDRFGSTAAVRQSIETLAKPDCVAVLTGQQAGLFAGPVLTIYKALTALRVSDELRRAGFNSVPVFWIASDDHDLAEAATLWIPGANHRTPMHDARERLFGIAALPPYPVGTIRLPEAITALTGEYAASFAAFEWGGRVRERLAIASTPGSTFSEAFGRVMADIFNARGLILFDPRDPRAKRLAAPVFSRALTEAPALRTLLDDRHRELQQAGLKPQVAVLPHTTLVFLEDQGERRLLRTGHGGFQQKETGRQFTTEEILRLTERQPDRFSPNVLLRPLVQDHLFPTAAYVGGPAEISYFAQVEPLYRFFDRPMPVLWPRSSFTILDKGSGEEMDRLGLQLEDFFPGERHIFRKILRAQPGSAEDLLERLSRDIAQKIETLTPSVAEVDGSLAAAADRARSKILHRIASLESRFVSSEIRRNLDLRNVVARLLQSCYPNGNLQERQLGAHYLLARDGPSLLDILYSSIEMEDFRHQIVRL